MISGGNSKELLGHAMVFFMEGFETSAMVASAALYELTFNSHIQNNLFEELQSSFEGKDIDLDTLWSLPYLDKVVQGNECILKSEYRQFWWKE